MAVIVPATNRPATLALTVAAIEDARDGPEELIVVDRPAGLGPAGARNLGARQASGDLLVFVDADVAVHRDAFSKIRAAFAADGLVTAVFGSYDDDPAPGGLASDFRNLLHHHVHNTNAGPATTFWAGLGAVRREAFLDVGGFDERRFSDPSVEDIELGMRLVARGYLVVLDDEIQGTHLKRWTLAEMIRTDFMRRGVPWVRLLLERRTTSTALNLGWRNRVSAGASLAVVGGMLVRSPVVAAGAVGGLVALNRSFYALLLRRRGVRQALAGVPLHVLHHVVSSGALGAAVALHLRDRVRGVRSNSS
jgi:GT2 family glycosyltransferase